MEVKGSKFIVGTFQFLAVVLPGMVACFLWLSFQQVRLTSLDPGGLLGSETNQTVLFMVMSYLVGHVVAYVGSYIDELMFVRLRFSAYRNADYNARVTEIRGQAATQLPVLVSNFDWALGRLDLEMPSASGEVERNLADSKLFRGLAIIFFVAMLSMLVKGAVLLFIGFLGSFFFSASLYLFTRRQGTKKAFRYVIFLHERELQTEHMRGSP